MTALPSLVGKSLGHYRILEKIGEGGMGVVYRGHDERLGRDVALKVLPEAFARDPERLARFKREAQLLASLNHPRIAAIYGLEEFDGHSFLVLEYVPGSTLAERLKTGPLTLEDALEVCRQIAEALEEAHDKGTLHRDLKPANIKITPEGKVKVLDFGLAKAFAGEGLARDISDSPTVTSGSTREGIILGTAAYMSPEQARGKPVDKRADIWSFGCVLYEALTGRRAFRGETVSDTVASILKTEPDWQVLPEATPANIRVLLRRCLEKSPQGRLRDPGDARIEIEDALAGAPALAQAPLQTVVRETRWSAILLAFVLGAVAAGLPLWRRGTRRSPGPAMRFSAITNFAGVEAQPSFSPDGRSVVFVSDRGGAYNLWVGLVSGGDLVRITNDSNLKVSPHWSPDGSKIAYARMNDAGIWDVWLVPALGGTPRRILSGATDPAWSPDGRTLAYANIATRTIWLCDSTGGSPQPLTQPEDFIIHRQPGVSHDGQRVAFIRRPRSGPFGELAVIERASGKVIHLTEDRALALSPAWSPDNKSIYFASSRGGTMNIWKIASDGGAPEQITAGQGDDAELDLSADGKRLVFSTYRENINLAEIAIDSAGRASPLKWLTTDPARGELWPSYSRDGKRIAYFTNRKGIENESIWVMDADGSNPIQLVEDERANIFPHWTPDGRSLVFVSALRGLGPDSQGGVHQVRRVSLAGGRPQSYPVETANVSADLTPDGRLLFIDPKGVVKLFDPNSNQTRATPVTDALFPHLSPDGRAIAYIAPPAGLWVYDLKDKPRQVFRGWVVSFAWAGPDQLLIAEGRADLQAPLWRVPTNGSPPVRLPASIHPINAYWMPSPAVGFDVNPDGRRIVFSALEVNDADIGMIENIQ